MPSRALPTARERSLYVLTGDGEVHKLGRLSHRGDGLDPARGLVCGVALGLVLYALLVLLGLWIGGVL